MKNNIFIIANINLDERSYSGTIAKLAQIGVSGISVKKFQGKDHTLKLKVPLKPLRIFDQKQKKEFEKNAMIILSVSSINSRRGKRFDFEKGQKIILNGETLNVFHEYSQILDSIVAKHVNLYGIILNDFHLNEEHHLQSFVDIRMIFPKLKILFGVKEENNRINKIQAALDLGFDGLYFDLEGSVGRMISNIKSLQCRADKKMNKSDKKEFEHLRIKIDKIDNELLQLLSGRRKIIEKIAEIKKENEMKIFQARRWKSILDSSLKNTGKLGIGKGLLSEILHAVHSDAIRTQLKIYTGRKKR